MHPRIAEARNRAMRFVPPKMVSEDLAWKFIYFCSAMSFAMGLAIGARLI